MEALTLHESASREVTEEEVYAKLIAMAAVGIEEAAAYTGGLASLAAREVLARLHPPPGGLEDAIRWINENTAFRIRSYVVGGRFVRDEDDGKAFYFIVYECPIRQILYLEDLPYGRTLCRIGCSYLERLLGERLGGRYRVSLDRAGPNACLIRGVVRQPPVPPELRLEAPSLTVEEYRRLLREALSLLLHAVADALYATLGGNVAMSYRAGKGYGRRVGAQILAEGYEASSLEEAVEVANAGLRGFMEVSLEPGGRVRIEWSKFHELIEREGLSHPEFVERLVQGFLAGVLETLLGERLDLRSTSEPRVYQVVTGHAKA